MVELNNICILYHLLIFLYDGPFLRGLVKSNMSFMQSRGYIGLI